MLKSKVVIVTGAGQGIGFTIARKLAAQGAQLVVNDIDPSLSEKATTAIHEMKVGNVIIFPVMFLMFLLSGKWLPKR